MNFNKNGIKERSMGLGSETLLFNKETALALVQTILNMFARNEQPTKKEKRGKILRHWNLLLLLLVFTVAACAGEGQAVVTTPTATNIPTEVDSTVPMQPTNTAEVPTPPAAMTVESDSAVPTAPAEIGNPPDAEGTPISPQAVVDTINTAFPEAQVTVEQVEALIDSATGISNVSYVAVGETYYVVTRNPLAVQKFTAAKMGSDASGNTLLFDENNTLVATINTNNATVTATAEAEAAPTPPETPETIDLSTIDASDARIQLGSVTGGQELFTMITDKDVYPQFEGREIGDVTTEIILGGAGEKLSSFEVPSANLVVYSLDGIIIGVFNPETNEVLPAVGGREFNFKGETVILPFPVLLYSSEKALKSNKSMLLNPREGETLIETQQRLVHGYITWLALKTHPLSSLPEFGYSKNIDFTNFNDQQRQAFIDVLVQDLINQLDPNNPRKAFFFDGITITDLLSMQALIFRFSIENNSGVTQQYSHTGSDNKTALSFMLAMELNQISVKYFLGGLLSGLLRQSLPYDYYTFTSDNIRPQSSGTPDITDEILQALANMSWEEIKTAMNTNNPQSPAWNKFGLPVAQATDGDNNRIIENPLTIPDTDPVSVLTVKISQN